MTEAVVRSLPWHLDRVVPPSVVGFAIINGFTFCVDLTLLTLLHSAVDLPLWLAITLSYACSFGLNFLLNRAFNFRSRSPVGPQLAVYVAVVAVNYLLWILGVGAGLTAMGIEYHVARTASAVCEGIYMYCAMRWLVFRER